MKIYLFRHAQKSFDFSGDPDLTPQGHGQAEKILQKVLRNELAEPTDLWVSPKKRAVSTFRPLADHFHLPLQIQDSLLEQQSQETLLEFRGRIERTLTSVPYSKDRVLYLCTHYDWMMESMAVIPSDMDLITPDFAHWSPAQYITFEVHPDGLFQFIETHRI